MNIAFFISPHGFGHAARAAAIMVAVQKMSSCKFHLFTLVPEIFFTSSGVEVASYHSAMTDVGFVQPSPLKEDLPGTIERLQSFIPFKESTVQLLTEKVNELGCTLICCDIAPLGLAVAKHAGIRSVLIENFLWDWIYEEYLESEPRFKFYIDYFKKVFDDADFRIQLKPVGIASPHASLSVDLIARLPKSSRSDTRKLLNVAPDQKLVLITMGGIYGHDFDLSDLSRKQDINFIITGSPEEYRKENVYYLKNDSKIYNPDLIGACDLLIGKLGYSTVAEVYQAGTRFMYMHRPLYRESEVMKKFVQENLTSAEISSEMFSNGEWVKAVDDLLAQPGTEPRRSSGADDVARFILRQFDN